MAEKHGKIQQKHVGKITQKQAKEKHVHEHINLKRLLCTREDSPFFYRKRNEQQLDQAQLTHVRTEQEA